MKRLKKYGLIWSLLLMTSATGLFGQAGGAAVPFLLISPDARASGMGEVGTAIADDINAVFWNPAGLGFQSFVVDPEDPDGEEIPFREVSITYSQWLPQFNAGLYYSYATIGQHIEQINGTLAVNFILMNLGEFQKTNEVGDNQGTFLSNEFALALAYGTVIATDLSLGFQLRYIQSNLAPIGNSSDGDAGVGRSGSFDIGLLWKPTDLSFGDYLDLGERLGLGFNLSNVGPKMTYKAESDPLPTMLRLGVAINLYRDAYNELTFAGDFGKLLIKRNALGSDPLPTSFITAWDNPGGEYAMGVEYWYERIFAFRAGYFSEPSAIGDREYLNFGAGVRYNIFQLDFSFINTLEENHPLANTMRFSMLIDISKISI